MMSDKQEIKYLRAKDRVKKIRGFYGHLAIFLLVLFTGILAPLIELSYCMVSLPCRSPYRSRRIEGGKSGHRRVA